MIFSRVVLPAVEGPTMASNSPCATSNDSGASTWTG